MVSHLFLSLMQRKNLQINSDFWETIKALRLVLTYFSTTENVPQISEYGAEKSVEQNNKTNSVGMMMTFNICLVF